MTRVAPELDPADVVRAQSLPPRRRTQFLRGRALVAGLVQEAFVDGKGWSIGSRACPRCGERHAGVELTGVPAVAGVAHADDLAVAVLAPSALVGRVGVDVEAVTPDDVRDGDLVRLLGGPPETVVRRWTRIEAVLKADGRGLLVDPGAVRLRRTTASVVGDPVRYRLAEVPGPAGFVISVAWCAPGPGAVEPDPAIR